jgi:hypothetical protein
MLRAETPAGGSVEQSVVICEEWQTQLFVQRGWSRFGRARAADLASAAVLMAESGTGFDPERPDLRSAELARQGLRDYRKAIAEPDLKALLGGKADNPMLGIYGLHLLRHQEAPNRNLIRKVVRRLRDLVGAHPDVQAIDLWLGDGDDGDFSAPPMLKSSWSIIVQASAEQPELVPRGSLSARIAQRILSGGPWLRWRTPQTRLTLEPSPLSERPLGESLAGIAAALPADSRELVERFSEVGPAESSVISLAKQEGEGAAALPDSDVLKALRVPRTVAEDVVGLVLRRLEK